jgi:hypothetical protein
MERKFAPQLEVTNIAFIAMIRLRSDHTTRLNKQQSIPVLCAAEGGYTEARVPPHELLNDDTVRAVPDVVELTTCEAEYYSTVDATKEGLHLPQFIIGEIFNASITETTAIWEDNQSAIAYSQNAFVNEKAKHIGLKWHFLMGHVEQVTIKSGGLSL